MFDFNQMGRLMELVRDINTDDLVELADKVDLPELIRVVKQLDDEQITHFEEEVRRVAESGGQPFGEAGKGPSEAVWRHRPFRRAAVLGAGTMGAQIAAHLANVGLDVLLLDVPASEGDRSSVAMRGLDRAKKLRPAPFFDDAAVNRIATGNFDDDFEAISDAEWVVEAVVERLDVKRSVMERIERHAHPAAIISTNTSGIPIHEIADGRSDSFRRRFLGAHFFNPPRYLKLVELIPTPETDAAVLDRLSWFARVHLGKGIVVAKDVPYFIANRVGVYGQLQAMRWFTDGDYSIEEIDLLTGPLSGRPKSATFRTADVVGLDVLVSVTENLYRKATNDENRDAFRAPDLLKRLVDKGALGAKTAAGFYRKEGRDILSVDPSTLEYRQPSEARLGDIQELKRKPLEDRLRALYEDNGRAGAFFRETTLDLLAYAARRIPEITDSPADVDRAMRWGFGWEMGPFEIWDVLGFDRVLVDMRREGLQVPSWVEDLARKEAAGIYTKGRGVRAVYVPPEEQFVADPPRRDQLSLGTIGGHTSNVIWQNDQAALLDAGDGVAVFEFRSRGNALGVDVMTGLEEAIEIVESRADLRGMVIGNEGKNFAVGANLFDVAKALEQNDTAELERYVAGFQDAVLRVRYAMKPVVVAVHQRALGGACEMLMACPNPVASAESYVGLVELGVGLIPGGTGSTHLVALASERAPNGHPSEVQAVLQKFFENVAMARVSESATQAQALGYLSENASIVVNDDRRLFVAKRKVMYLSEEGYRPPPRRDGITVLGRPTRAAFEVQLQQYLEGRFISEYDRFLGSQLAYVMTGGDFSGPETVSEDYLLGLEREAIMRLLGEKKTQDRIRHMLETGKPLRN